MVVFDLDGTLLRGDTVCEVLAKPLGRLAEMRHFEQLTTETDIADARAEMFKWYQTTTLGALHSHLPSARWAPGAQEAVRQLQQANILIGIASITWQSAVRWFANALNVKHYLGTELALDGTINHVWGRDKASWFRALVDSQGIAMERTAAVGDSAGDIEMLSLAQLRFFVGKTLDPKLTSVVHLPDADLRLVSQRIIDAWVT